MVNVSMVDTSFQNKPADTNSCRERDPRQPSKFTSGTAPVALQCLTAVFAILLTACGGGSSPPNSTQPPPPPPAPTVTAIAIKPAAFPDGLLVGATRQLSATATLSDNTARSVTPSWASSNEAAVTVSAGGLIEVLATGTATITATFDGVEGTVGVEGVDRALTSIEVGSPSNEPLTVGLNRQFTAVGIYADTSRRLLTGDVDWESSDTGVLVFSTETKGLANAVTAGMSNVTASTAGITSSPALAVRTAIPGTPIGPGIPPNGRVEIGPADAPELPANAQLRLTASYIAPGGRPEEFTKTAVWSSDNQDVGTVSNVEGSQGLFTAVSAGTVTVSAKNVSKDVTGSRTITVTDAEIDSLEIIAVDTDDGQIPSPLPVGLRFRVAALATLSNDDLFDVTDDVVWTSSSPAAVSVLQPAEEPGVAYLIVEAPGMANVTALLADTTLNDEVAITAAAASLDQVRVSPSTPPSVPVGLTQQFEAVGLFDIDGVEGTREFIVTPQATFASSAATVATISNAAGSFGLATGRSIGNTAISASIPDGPIAVGRPLNVTAPILTGLGAVPQGNQSFPLAGRALQYEVTGTYSDMSTRDLTDEVTYYSDDNRIVAWDRKKKGRLFYENIGNTAITIFTETGAGMGATIGIGQAVEVTGARATSVSISGPGDLSRIATGSKVQLSAEGTFDDMTEIDVTLGCAWTSDNAERGTFTTTPGELIARAAGTFNVACTLAGTQRFEQPVTVVASGLTTGVWRGAGMNTDGSSYEVCFNVARDRNSLTPTDSTCDQGAAFALQISNQTDDAGNPCAINVLRADKVKIVFQAAFVIEILSGVARELVTADFDNPASASGTGLRTQFSPTATCRAAWAASPE